MTHVLANWTQEINLVGQGVRKSQSEISLLSFQLTMHATGYFKNARRFVKLTMIFYLNEDLTKFRSEILFEARSLRRARKLNSAYSSDGKLFVRDLEDRRHQISSLDDLVKFGYTRESEHGRSVGPQPSTSGVGSVEY